MRKRWYLSVIMLLVLLFATGIGDATAPPTVQAEKNPSSKTADAQGAAASPLFIENVTQINARSPSLQADAENVEFVGHIGGCAWAVTVEGNYAYVANRDGGLRMIDVSDPTTPNEVGSCDTPGSAYDMAVSSDYAYVADGYGGLRVIDVHDPTTPSEVSFYVTPGQPRGVAVSGDYAYVADWDSYIGFVYNGLRVVDVSDPSSPSEVSFSNTPGDAYDVGLSGGHAYLTDRSGGLRVIDVNDPTTSSEVGYCDTPGYASGVAVSGGHAYVADYYTGLRVIDVNDPTTPSEVGYCNTPGYASGVAVSGDHAYVADGLGGLRVIDVSDPSSPNEVGYCDTPGYGSDVGVSGDYAYLADGEGGLFILRYTGTSSVTYAITGHVRDGSGSGIAGVTVSADATGGATTDADGAYIISGLTTGTYVLTASKSGYEFSPSARVVRVPPEATGQDFTSTPVYGNLTGRITDKVSGVGVANARVSAAGRVVRSDVNGHYTLTGLLPGLHNIYVSADGYGDQRGEATIEAHTSIIKDVALTPISISGYYLPYPGGRRYKCTQGNGGIYSHTGNWHYAFDFGMPEGHQVVAAREGRVVAVKDNSNTGCGSSACTDQANYIRVRHEDGTDTLYYHLKYKSAVVNEDDFVSRGQLIAESDTTGWCTGPHLDFTRHNWGQWNSIPVAFTDVAGDGAPKTDEWYTSENYATSQTLSPSEAAADTDAPQGDVQLRLTDQPTHTLVLSAFDYITNVSEVRLAPTEPDLQAANWVPFTTRMTWTERAAFAQYRDTNGNISTVVSDTVDAIGYEPLEAAFVVSSTVCVGQGLSLTNRTTPFCEQCGWFWDFGDGTTSEEAEPEFGYVAASSFAGYESSGVYTITLTATSAVSASSVSHQVEALSRPSADFALIRSGATITVEAEATDAAGWSWDFGDGSTATGRIATHSYSDTVLLNRFPVQLEVEGTNGCLSRGYRYVPPISIYVPLVLRDR